MSPTRCQLPGPRIISTHYGREMGRGLWEGAEPSVMTPSGDLLVGGAMGASPRPASPPPPRPSSSRVPSLCPWPASPAPGSSCPCCNPTRALRPSGSYPGPWSPILSWKVWPGKRLGPAPRWPEVGRQAGARSEAAAGELAAGQMPRPDSRGARGLEQAGDHVQEE